MPRQQSKDDFEVDRKKKHRILVQGYIYRPCVLNILGGAIASLPSLYATGIGEVFQVQSPPLTVTVPSDTTSVTIQFSTPKDVILNTLQAAAFIGSVSGVTGAQIASASVIAPQEVEVVVQLLGGGTIPAGSTLTLSFQVTAMRFPDCRKLCKSSCGQVSCDECPPSSACN